MGQGPPKPISRSKLRQLAKLPCDGVPRYSVKGSILDFRVPYSTAYEQIFELEGGTWTDPQPEGVAKVKEEPRRIWTAPGVRRAIKLNEQYRPFAARVIASQRAAADLLRRTPTQFEDGPVCPPTAAPST